VPKAEHGGEADALVPLEPRLQLAHDGIPELGLLESPGEAEAADVDLTSTRQPELDRARGNVRKLVEVVGEVRGVEVLEPEVDEDEAAASTEVAVRHRLRHDRGGLRRADGGREQEVCVERTLVTGHAGLEPLDARRNDLHRKPRVRVLPRELRQSLGGALTVRAENVDRRRCEVRRADALGDHEHAPALVGQPECRRQAGEPGADDDGVVRHVGRRWTASTPWKIQSSSRACRIWSP
jgi:hypothetical protein